MIDFYPYWREPEAKATWIPNWVLRLLPGERHRATVLLICGGCAGYLSPPLIQALGDRWQFPLEEAKIEQLRRDGERVPCREAQQVMARVIEMNLEIARKHRENALWYTDGFVTDRWNQVPLIPIPCEGSE